MKTLKKFTMGQLYSKYFGDKVLDESTSNSSLSGLRYVTATVHAKPRWKSIFNKKETLPPSPRLPARPIPGTPHGCKTLITPRGVTMIYPQKRKFTPFRQKAEASPTGDRNYPKQATPRITKRRFR